MCSCTNNCCAVAAAVYQFADSANLCICLIWRCIPLCTIWISYIFVLFKQVTRSDFNLQQSCIVQFINLQSLDINIKAFILINRRMRLFFFTVITFIVLSLHFLKYLKKNMLFYCSTFDFETCQLKIFNIMEAVITHKSGVSYREDEVKERLQTSVQSR